MLLKSLGKTNCLTHIPNDINLELDPLNATVVGSPTIINGVASGFSTSNYLIFNGAGTVPAGNLNSFEIAVKVKTPTTWTSNGRVINPTNGADSTTAPYIEVNQQGAHLQWYNGSYFYCTALENLSSNTTYWFKWVYDGSTIKGYYSTNGSDYILNSTTTPPYKPYFNSTEMGIGCRVSDKYSGCVWNGSVDLKETYIKVNGSIWWKGGSGNLTLKAGSKVYVPNGKTEQKYYKYTYEDWAQPVLSANGTVGGDSFAVEATTSSSSYPAYKAFDNTNGYWIAQTVSAYITFYNPKPLKVTNLHIKNPNYSDHNYASLAGVIYGSDDNLTWVEIAQYTNSVLGNLAEWDIDLSTNTKFYKYHKIQNTKSNKDWVGFAEITITAQQLTGSVESTADDYDYMVESGQNIFDEVVIESDKTLINNWGTNGSILIFLTPDKHLYQIGLITERVSSGSTAPTATNGQLWYDTTNNIIKKYAGGSLEFSGCSLPIALCNKTDGANSTIIASIDQVFNGFGYIGSTIYALPGVKGLISNSWDEGGRYNNIECSVNNVITTSAGWDGILYLSGNNGYNSSEYNTIAGPTEQYYDSSKNEVWYDNQKVYWTEVARVTVSDGKITSLTPRVVQTKHDYKNYILSRKKKLYYKYDEESTLINADGVVTSATGGNGWVIYPQTNYNEVFLMLNATAKPSYPRWQTSSPNAMAYIKTPQKGIITHYLTTQWCDDNSTGRICNRWRIAGYETEADMLALANGVIVHDGSWASASKGASNTFYLTNNKAFQYYTIHMVSNFANGSYCSMGNTKFYMRESVPATSIDYDYWEWSETKRYLLARNGKFY